MARSSRWAGRAADVSWARIGETRPDFVLVHVGFAISRVDPDEAARIYQDLRSTTPISKIGHNAMAALSYLGLYSLVVIEMITGLVMFNWLRHSPILGPLIGWIPRFISFPNIRLIHFLLMFVFISFGIFHVHVSMLISREEKRGLMDSIFTGYKVIPADELQAEEKNAAMTQNRP